MKRALLCVLALGLLALAPPASASDSEQAMRLALNSAYQGIIDAADNPVVVCRGRGPIVDCPHLRFGAGDSWYRGSGSVTRRAGRFLVRAELTNIDEYCVAVRGLSIEECTEAQQVSRSVPRHRAQRVCAHVLQRGGRVPCRVKPGNFGYGARGMAYRLKWRWAPRKAVGFGRWHWTGTKPVRARVTFSEPRFCGSTRAFSRIRIDYGPRLGRTWANHRIEHCPTPVFEPR